MDEQYLYKMRRDIMLALKKAEADLYNHDDPDLEPVFKQVEVLQAYISKHTSSNPSENLKTIIYDTFNELQIFSDRLAAEVKLTKSKISEEKINQKLTNAYMYGVRK